MDERRIRNRRRGSPFLCGGKAGKPGPSCWGCARAAGTGFGFVFGFVFRHGCLCSGTAVVVVVVVAAAAAAAAAAIVVVSPSVKFAGNALMKEKDSSTLPRV